MKNYTLGIDMGVASIGWACLSREDQEIDSGARIFPAGIDKFGSSKETHLNQDRRKARGARRRCARAAKRKQLIRNILTALGWIPTDKQELAAWENLDVYALRHKALSEKISLKELARIILHINQRRGFLSLRKSELSAAEGDAKKELDGMLGDINRLQAAIADAGCQTLGSYLYKLYEANGIHNKLRSRHIRRSMLHDEFSLIWAHQSPYHPELSDTLRYGSHGKQDDPIAVTRPIPREKDKSLLQQFGIENLTFFQRKVYWPIDSIGHCELEPDELRAPISDRRFQEFRMLQELNNLRIFDQSTPGRPKERILSEAERKTALTYLSTTKEPTLKTLKKKLAKLDGSPSADQITFNLEASDREKISGLSTEFTISKTLGENYWNTLDEATKNNIVEILILPLEENKKVIQPTDAETRQQLETIPSLTDEQIEALQKLSFKSGYCNLSVKALENLLPHLRKGLHYIGKKGDDTNSAIHLAGYKRRDEHSAKVHKFLPTIQQLTNPKDTTFYDEHFPHINNPLVLRALTELRKVVNAIIRKHGKPTSIHLEMTRDLKMSAKQREEHNKKNRKHEKERNKAKNELAKLGVANTQGAILLYRLWEEQGKQSIYSGKSISITQLLSGDVDIDHIYPRRANDDSYMNKVVCFAEENRLKGDRLPIEYLGASSDAFEALTQRAASLPYPKRQRLMAKEIPEGFANRDFTDTSYMTKAAKHYLTALFEKPHHVFCPKGKHTAFLRRQWQLNDLLRSDLLDLKNRDDHRHHALDAIVIAACDQSLMQHLSREMRYENTWKEKEIEGKKIRIYRLKSQVDNLKPLWQNFRIDVHQSLDAIWVSHRAKRKLSGALHEETNYGSTKEPGILVRRKPLESLTNKEIKNIRDPQISEIIHNYLEREKALYPEDFGAKMDEEVSAFFAHSDRITSSEIDSFEDSRLQQALHSKLDKKNPLQDAAFGKIVMPSGIPIKKVRIKIANKAAIPLRPENNPKELVIPGNTHHLTIFSLGDGKCHFEPVTLLEVSRRKRCNETIIQQHYHGMPPEAEYMFHLCTGDSMMTTIDGKDELFIYSTMASTTKQVFFIHHLDARPSKEVVLKSCRPNTFHKNFPNARKVTILPSGEIRYTND